MPPLGPRNHRITLEEAAQHTRRHREARARGHDIHAGAFHADQVLQLLQQKGCAAMRIYLGRDAKGESSLVLVGVDVQGEDMTGGTILEVVYTCPPFCSTTSVLNTGA